MNTDTQGDIRRATWAHVLPFAVWLVLMYGLGEPAGWKYAVRSVACLAVLMRLRPWQWYGPLRTSNLPLACGVGLLAFVVWIWPESEGLGVPGSLQSAYLRWGVLPLGQHPAALEQTPYAPLVCGWPLSLVRWLGSAFVIAVIEEFFWRGFLYRWLIGKNFTGVDLGRWHLGFFLLVSLAFGFEHHRWLAGLVAGMLYAAVMIRTRDLWAAALAHVITNLLLGTYVLATGAYEFW